MEMTPATTTHHPTPEFVLSALIDSHRQQCGYDDLADPEAELSFATTVQEWRDACDLVDWRPLGEAMNWIWGLTCSDEQWRDVLEPGTERTLADVCGFLSKAARVEDVGSVTILGRECKAAAAFYAIRSILGRAGADVRDISPSTPIGEYARLHLGEFLVEISRLAPGALPRVKVSHPVYDLLVAGTGVGMLVGVLSMLFLKWYPELVAMTSCSFAVGAVCYALTAVAAKRPPRKVQFGDVRTFRDLARTIAEHLGRQGQRGSPSLVPPSPK
jgi:hypothetical protein